MNFHDVIIAPIITEKGSQERARNRYLFKVMPDSTKIDIKRAVEKVFKVGVLDVNTVWVRGKKLGAKKGRFGLGKSWKKAYVTLKQGQKIETLDS